MKKILVRTRTNYVPGKGTKVKGRSETIQNDSLTVAQLLLKHISGAEISEKQGVYIEDADHDDLDGQKFHQADLADKEAIRLEMKAMRERLKQEEEEYNREQKARKSKKEEPPKQPENEG